MKRHGDEVKCPRCNQTVRVTTKRYAASTNRFVETAPRIQTHTVYRPAGTQLCAGSGKAC